MVQPAEKTRGHRRRTARGPPARRTVLLATDSEKEGESTNKNSANVYADVFQQVTMGGSFSCEQRDDERLRHCWEQVRRVDGENRLPPPHPLPHFVISNGLLYCVAHRQGEEKLLLVVPPGQGGDSHRTGPLSPHGWSSGSDEHSPKDPGSFSLAWARWRGKKILTRLPYLPKNVSSSSSPQPTNPAACHRGAF